MALETLRRENGRWIADIVVANKNRLGIITSYDYGCMQLNDKAHFGYDGWTQLDQAKDPAWNVQYAVRIYRRAGNTFKPWFAVCTPGREVPGIRCK
jgi:hypothetical protein